MNKSQSTLEYMVNNGWAILLIIIMGLLLFAQEFLMLKIYRANNIKAFAFM